MKALVVLLVVAAAGVVGLGFYLGWFSVTSSNADDKSNITLAVDTDKIKNAKTKAISGLQDFGHQVKNQVAGPVEKKVDGTLVSVSGDKLTMTSEGNEQGHMLNPDVKVTCDGKSCKAAELKSGMRIRVSVQNDDAHAVTRIEALDKNADFASSVSPEKTSQMATKPAS